MIHVQDENLVEGVGEHRIDLIILRLDRETHAHEVRSVVEFIAREDEGLADGIFERHGGDGRHLGDHAVAGDKALLRIVDVGGVVIEGGKRPDDPDHDRHRMRVAAEAVVEVLKLLMHHGVHGDRMFEIRPLFGVGQFAVQKQISNLDEVRMLGKLVDGIAAVKQDPLIAVDERDLGFAARR